jgi:formylglycine-generating enzyme required for sulfatase activity
VDITKSGYRLPSHDEWVHAYRAGSGYPWSPNIASTDYAWLSENSSGWTHPVGKKLPNPWGLYDMFGNVMEWTMNGTSDWQCADGNSYRHSVSNTTGTGDNPVGSYNFNTCGYATNRVSNMGFRPVRNAPILTPILNLLLN